MHKLFTTCSTLALRLYTLCYLKFTGNLKVLTYKIYLFIVLLFTILCNIYFICLVILFI